MDDAQTSRLRVLRMLCDPRRWQEFRQAQFTVADVMSTPPLTISSSQLCRDTLELFSANHIRHVLVTEGEKLVGIISDRDVLGALRKGQQGLEQPVKDVATASPLVANTETSVEDVAS